MALSDSDSLGLLWGVVAFCFCLIVTTLLFVLKLWLDVYHNRFFEFVNKNNEKQIEILKIIKEEVKRR